VPDFQEGLTVVIAAILTYVGGMLALYFCVLVPILIHELGHFAMGLVCGLRLYRFRIGGIELERSRFGLAKYSIRWHFYWRWRYLWSGAIVMHAKTRALTRTRLRYGAYVLGGVLGNFASACVALPIAREDTMAGGIAKYFLVGSVLMGLGNLIPFTAGPFRSDGAELWTLLSNRLRTEARLYWFTLAVRVEEICALQASGQPHRAWEAADKIIRKGDGLPEAEVSEKQRQALARLKELFINKPSVPAIEGQASPEVMTEQIRDSAKAI
jgi:hypothetical protein